MRTLCIDTSGPAVIAIVDGAQTLAEAVEPNARRHAESLGVLLSETLDALTVPALAEAGIDRVCVGVGPGPFTGLRAGIVFASTLGRGLGVPVLGVGSLDGLARVAIDHVGDDGPVLAVTDAKRREIYWGIYTAKGIDDIRPVGGPNVGPAADALAAGINAGVGAIAGPREVLESLELTGELDGIGRVLLEVNPAVFARIVDARPGADFPLTPLYLRRPDIHGQPTEAMLPA